MDKTDCYKCNREPSVECGECPVWLADEEVSEKERVAFQQGAKDFAEWLISHSMLCDSLGQDISDCYDGDNNKAIEDVLAEWKKEVFYAMS